SPSASCLPMFRPSSTISSGWLAGRASAVGCPVGACPPAVGLAAISVFILLCLPLMPTRQFPAYAQMVPEFSVLILIAFRKATNYGERKTGGHPQTPGRGGLLHPLHNKDGG